MAQYRALHTKITQSFDFNEMPDDFTRLMWALMPLALDSEGRGIFNSSWIRSRLFPLREDVTAKQIMAAMDWIVDRGMLVKYEVDGRQYFYSPTFKSYQRGLEKETKSVLPAPELVESNSVPTPEQLQSNSRPTPELGESNSLSNKTELNGTKGNADGSVIPAPTHDYQFSQGWQIRVFTGVTNLSGIPGSDMPKVMEALDSLRSRFTSEDELIAYLKPYFENWLTRKTRDGRRYSKSNCAWLYDMALAEDTITAPKLDRVMEVFHAPKYDPNCPLCHGKGKYMSEKVGRFVACDCEKVYAEVEVSA